MMKIIGAILLLVAIAESKRHHPLMRHDRAFDIEELEDYMNAVRHHRRDFFDQDEDKERDLGKDDAEEDFEENDLENFRSMEHHKMKDHNPYHQELPTEEGKPVNLGQGGPPPPPPSTTTPEPTTAKTTTTKSTTHTKPAPPPTSSPSTKEKVIEVSPTPETTEKPKSKLHELLKHFSVAIRSLRHNEAMDRKTMLRLFNEVILLKGKVRSLERQSLIESMFSGNRFEHRGNAGGRSSGGHMFGGLGMNEREGGEEGPFGHLFLSDEE